MRTATVLLLLAMGATACSGPSSPEVSTPPGCDLVPAGKIRGLVGAEVRTTARGTLTALRARHTEAVCRSVVPGHPERNVTIVAQYHPRPYRLPGKACSEGWVYAGDPDKFTPACQETVDGHGRTQLVVRWQPYLMRVTIGRSGHDWAGDPELALEISRIVAQRLGVDGAADQG